MAEQQAPEHRHYDPLTSEGPRRKKGIGTFGVATIIVIGLLGVFTSEAISILERRLLAWRDSEKRRN